MATNLTPALSDEKIFSVNASYETDALILHELFKWDYSVITESTTPRYSSSVCDAMKLVEYIKSHKPVTSLLSNTINISYLDGNWFVNLYGCKSFDKSLSLAIAQVALLFSKYL